MKGNVSLNFSKTVAIAVLLGSGLFASCYANERGYRHDQRADYRHSNQRPTWQHRDITRFHERDVNVWRSGAWRHARHNGRSGWWWIVGGAWYFYPTQVLPYPDPYQPSVITSAPSTAAPQYWYYCRSPAGYYPYVARCRVSWQAVPATVP